MSETKYEHVKGNHVLIIEPDAAGGILSLRHNVDIDKAPNNQAEFIAWLCIELVKLGPAAFCEMFAATEAKAREEAKKDGTESLLYKVLGGPTEIHKMTSDGNDTLN